MLFRSPGLPELPAEAGDSTGTGRGSGGRFNVPAGTRPIGASESQSVKLANGKTVTVNKRAAAQFQGFFNDLIAAGAPVRNLGGVGPRGNPSQHPVGLAVDWAQHSRNVVDRDVQAWISNNPDVLNNLERKWGISGGEHWKNPDTGHFSIDTLFGSKHLEAIRAGNPAGQPGTGQPADEQRNVRNFMRGLSFLETSNNPRIAARSEGGNTGFFRQNANDAAWAIAHGLPDPRVGTYQQQADANFAYMQKYPGAQEAIRRGDFKEAARLLHKNWVGLPGGSQPQSAARMREWLRILEQGDTRTHRVHGSGKISVHVNAPKGTHVGAEGKGLFKEVEINRQTQMEPARRGPVPGFEA